MQTLNDWRTTWTALGISAPEDLFHQLIARYSEPHRKYHTLRHLDECFRRFSEVRSQSQRPEEIELAIWFHDAVYDTSRGDNEEKSARWARSALLDAGLPEATANRVYALILLTRHDRMPEENDARIVVDVDLSILGAKADRFDEYEHQIRQEYAWVPDFLFRRKRKKLIDSFLARPFIFNTEHFRKTYEARARENLARSLDRLSTSKPAKPK